jgi:xanthine dehydrogenase accessory factor
MLVDDTAHGFGTIGGGCVEAEVRKRAFEMLSRNASGLLTFKLDHDYGWDDGLICGGTIELAVGPLPDTTSLTRIADDIAARRAACLDLAIDTERGPVTYRLRMPPSDRLYIAGAGHVGQALARLGRQLEFDVTLFDDRVDLLEQITAPGDSSKNGVTRQSGDIAESLGAAPVDHSTFCVIVTRGHRHDEQVLEALVGRGAAYVGMIGSRRKVKLIFDDLRERGVAQEHLDVVHAPIGLDIGAISVEEIALAIAAQLVQIRRTHQQTLIETVPATP